MLEANREGGRETRKCVILYLRRW